MGEADPITQHPDILRELVSLAVDLARQEARQTRNRPANVVVADFEAILAMLVEAVDSVLAERNGELDLEDPVLLLRARFGPLARASGDRGGGL